MPDTDRQYVLVSDDDGHWYVCPADKQSEAAAYFAEVTRFWDDPSDVGDPPEEPAWLEQVGGAPSRVKFIGYVIE